MKKLILSLLAAVGFIGSASASVLTGDLTNGLVAYYTFDNTLSDVTGTLSALNNYGTSFSEGPIDGENALVFNYGQYGTISGLGSKISNAVTVSGWYKFNAGISHPMEYGSGFKAVSFSGTLSDGSNPTFRVNVSGSPHNNIDLNLGDSIVRTGYQVMMNQWYYITVVASGGISPNYSFYVNGQNQMSGNGSVPTNLNFNYDYGVGATIDGGDAYWGTLSQGGIANLAFYNRALSATEVFQLYTIPEPSTYALFGIGAIGMLMVMRRKKIA
jgi:hypothetical protein